jgi:hypothetical protein
MKPHYRIALAMLGSFALGAASLEGLRAQVKPPAYVISEIEVTNADAYAKEYVPLANKALADSGQKRLAFAAACPEADLFRSLPGALLPLGP